MPEIHNKETCQFPFHVIPVPHQVRGKLPPESSKTLDAPGSMPGAGLSSSA